MSWTTTGNWRSTLLQETKVEFLFAEQCMPLEICCSESTRLLHKAMSRFSPRKDTKVLDFEEWLRKGPRLCY